MKVCTSIEAIRREVIRSRGSQKPVGLVPTMGALHDGHESLIARARSDCAFVVVSIFVNPLQFGPREDLDLYPRSAEADHLCCQRLGVDWVFAPDVEELYPRPPLVQVEVKRITEQLCGTSREGHFQGVALVVLKLLNIVEPDRAYFGEKDAQQTALVRRLVEDLNVPIEVIEVPTVRDRDGLALSSRNEYLDAEHRQIAPALYQTLLRARGLIQDGERDPATVRLSALEVLQAHPQIRLDYLEVVDPEDMQPVSLVEMPVRVAIAAWVGTTRLIDNVLVTAK